jgi:hypothetical protein
LQRIQARKIRANVEIEDHNIADLLSWYGSKYPLRIRSLRTKSQEFCVHILETLVPLRSHRNGHSFSSINFISFNPPPSSSRRMPGCNTLKQATTASSLILSYWTLNSHCSW